jgi:hypothetical protein
VLLVLLLLLLLLLLVVVVLLLLQPSHLHLIHRIRVLRIYRRLGDCEPSFYSCRKNVAAAAAGAGAGAATAGAGAAAAMLHILPTHPHNR